MIYISGNASTNIKVDMKARHTNRSITASTLNAVDAGSKCRFFVDLLRFFLLIDFHPLLYVIFLHYSLLFPYCGGIINEQKSCQRHGGRSLLKRGGDAMITYEAFGAICTFGLLLVAVIALFNDRR